MFQNGRRNAQRMRRGAGKPITGHTGFYVESESAGLSWYKSIAFINIALEISSTHHTVDHIAGLA
ncbi:MAG TPA: hypothetical protein GXZ82_07715 [Firmicutes bacterium]|jgi:hypothetical protein|nr:hypothetical protein [Bacillota bacterium]